MVETGGVFKKDFLDTTDSEMHGRSLYGSEDLGFDLGGLGIECWVFDRLGSEFHGGGQKRCHHADKRLDFVGVRGVFFQVLYLSQQMGIAVLEGARGFVVTGVTVYNENARQGFLSKDHLRHFSRAGFAERKEADVVCSEEPNIAILPIGSPTGFIGVLDRGLAILLDQFREDGSQQMSQAMKTLDEASRIDSELFTDPTQGDAVQVVHYGRGGDQLVTK